MHVPLGRGRNFKKEAKKECIFLRKSQDISMMFMKLQNTRSSSQDDLHKLQFVFPASVSVHRVGAGKYRWAAAEMTKGMNKGMHLLYK